MLSVCTYHDSCAFNYRSATCEPPPDTVNTALIPQHFLGDKAFTQLGTSFYGCINQDFVQQIAARTLNIVDTFYHRIFAIEHSVPCVEMDTVSHTRIRRQYLIKQAPSLEHDAPRNL